MKKLVSFLLLINVLSLKVAVSQHMIFYSNDEDGYSIEFPENWRRADEMKGKLSLVALAPEDTEAEDGVRERLHLAIFNLNGKTEDVFYSQFLASHEEKNRSWKLVEDGEIGAKGAKAKYFNCYYSDTTSGRTHSEYIYVFFKNKKAFVLTCTTSFDESDKNRDLFTKISSSFSFETSPGEE